MDLLVAEISKGEEQNISSSIRIAIERGWLNSFMDSLTDAKRRKETEIDRICSRHYGDFLTSVSEMLKLRSEAKHLTSLVTGVHRKFKTTGGDLVTVVDDLNVIQTERENASKLLECTMQCKKISTLMLQTKNQIESDDHYNAMRTIESIQIEAKQMKVKSMVSYLDAWLPVSINKLLYGARCEADGFLSTLRHHSELIGSTILCRQAGLSIRGVQDSHRHDLHPQGYGDSTPGRPGDRGWDPNAPPILASISLHHLLHHSRVFHLAEWAKADEFYNTLPVYFTQDVDPVGEEIVDAKLCELAPLHKVLHLYAILADLNAYHSHYRNSRDTFLGNMLHTAERVANQNGLVLVLPRLFNQIIGFFTIEIAIRRCVEIPEGVFSFAELAALWEDVCLLVNKLSRDLGVLVTSPEAFLQIKESLLLLIHVVTDDAFGFNPKPLYTAMKTMWDLFCGMQMSQLVDSCKKALESCTYQPYTCKTQVQFATHVQAFQLDSVEPAEEVMALSPGNGQAVGRSPESTGGSSNGTGVAATLMARRRMSYNQLKERESRRASMGKAAANLDALEEELSAGLTVSEGIDEGARNATRRRSVAPDGRSVSVFSPHTYAFSSAVPILLRELHTMVTHYFLFAVKNPSLGAQSEEICRSISAAFVSICASLKQELTKDGMEMPLYKASQIAVDGATFVSASDALWLVVENGLKHFHWSENLDKYILKAMETSTLALRSLVVTAQDLIFELLYAKIDALLESLAFINFVPATVPTMGHDSIQMIVDFLKVTLIWLANLPPTVREAVHFTCCSRVSQGVLDFITSSHVKQISQLSLLAFDLDLKTLVHFSDSCGIEHLSQCFQELQETVRCFLHPSLLLFGDKINLRRETFPYTHTSKLVTILDKMVPTTMSMAGHHGAMNKMIALDKNELRNLQKKFRAQLQKEG